MYKLLLCLCYLKTRYLAFVCVISVLLGVATLIVVNSVMSGFSTKMKSHMHGLASDVTMHTEIAEGFQHRTAHIEAAIYDSPIGKHVEAISPTVEVFALLQFQIQSGGQLQTVTKHVKVVGIDPERHSKVGKFADYLLTRSRPAKECFELTQEGLARFNQRRQWDFEEDLFKEREQKNMDRRKDPLSPEMQPTQNALGATIPKIIPREGELPAPNIAPIDVEMPTRKLPGMVLGFAIANYRDRDLKTGEMYDKEILKRGDDIFVATVGASGSKPVSQTFIITDYFKSEMTEYDANVVYVSLDQLQQLRGMDDRTNTIHIRLKDDIREQMGAVHQEILPELQDLMPKPASYVSSWWQQQGPIFAAIDIERGLLNILLFLIVGVAGFGVLAIFSMIVSEKFRDIGIMKSLGASNAGVMSIFIGYGLLLGLIGCVVGTVMGLAITDNINEIEQFISKKITGHEIFDRKVYYFDKIPTNVEWGTVLLVNAGAMGIALLSSVLPAWRAARLQPVQALRFE
jgi:lipoprotein-releasing system permease protein